MKRRDALLGAVGVGGLLVGAGCASDAGDDAGQAAGDVTDRTTSSWVTAGTGNDGNASAVPDTVMPSNARNGRTPPTRTPTIGGTPATAPTPTGTPTGIPQSTTVPTGTPQVTRSRTARGVSSAVDAPVAPATASPTETSSPTETRTSTEAPTPQETSTPPDPGTETPTPVPTPSRAPRGGVFASYDRSDRSGTDVIHFRIENANESDVRVALSVTWWHSDGSVLSERRASDLGPEATWEGDVAHSGGDERVNRWDASIESVTWS